MNTETRRAFQEGGSLTLEDFPFVLSRDMMPRDVERLPPGAVKRLHSGGTETRITLNPQRVLGVTTHLELHFEGDRLARIQMMAINECVPEVMAAGGVWSRENELARKRFHERWAAEALGCPLAVKPWVDPDLPGPVMPACPGPEHPRYAEFPWGEIISSLDEKACEADLIVKYSGVCSSPAG